MEANVTIARPYARAIFEFAKETKDFEFWNSTLSLATEVVKEKEVNDLLFTASNNSIVINIINAVVKDTVGDKNNYFDNFLKTLAEHNRLVNIPDIFSVFLYYRSKYDLPSPVEIISASEVSSTQLEKLKEALEKKVGKSVSLTVSIDKSLIAGLVIKTDEFIIDGSTRYQLDQLADTILC